MSVKFKLDQDDATDSIACQVMEHFTASHKSLKEKMLYLHYSASTNPMELAKLKRILKPLVEIQGCPVDDQLIPNLTLLITGGDTETTKEEMCQFVIDKLYESLLLCEGDCIKIRSWHQVCSIVVSKTYNLRMKLVNWALTLSIVFVTNQCSTLLQALKRQCILLKWKRIKKEE